MQKKPFLPVKKKDDLHMNFEDAQKSHLEL